MNYAPLAPILILSILATGCSGARTAFAPLPSSALGAPAAQSVRAAAARAKYVYVSGDIAWSSPSSGNAELAVYAASANGNAAPVHVFTGTASQLKGPEQPAVDASGRVWVCDTTADALFSYASGLSGQAPDTVITGSNTQLDGCGGVAIARSGAIYATSFGGNAVLEYAAGSHGNAAPIATLAGSLTTLLQPFDLAFDGSGRLYVANYGGRSTLVFGNGAGNVAPARTIAGSNTRTNVSYAVAIDPTSQRIVVANAGNDTVQVFAPGANGNAAPVSWIAGAKTMLVNPYGVAVDGAGYTYVGTCPTGYHLQAAILVFAPGARGNVAPVQTISGTKTNLGCVTGLAVR